MTHLRTFLEGRECEANMLTILQHKHLCMARCPYEYKVIMLYILWGGIAWEGRKQLHYQLAALHCQREGNWTWNRLHVFWLWSFLWFKWYSDYSL